MFVITIISNIYLEKNYVFLLLIGNIMFCVFDAKLLWCLVVTMVSLDNTSQNLPTPKKIQTTQISLKKEKRNRQFYQKSAVHPVSESRRVIMSVTEDKGQTYNISCVQYRIPVTAIRISFLFSTLTSTIFDRPGVAGAVLQTASSLIN